MVCFSHLRWQFVVQRPQHLMQRFAKDRQVIFWEESVSGDGPPTLRMHRDPENGILVVTPEISDALDGPARTHVLRSLLEALIGDAPVALRWYYTPMMLPFSRELPSACTVYDCMDELANFRFAPPELTQLEAELMGQADLVFTGGYSLYEAKRDRHPNVHPFPSSVDAAHFRLARQVEADPADQRPLPGPRLGFYGVIDERMDLALIDAVAQARPDWTLVMIGPVVKIRPEDLPQRPNIAYLGAKEYADLPAYLSGWDVALMPFAVNEATRFISPTKTPEYLAAGRPVVSTPVHDVIRHYASVGAVRIAADAPSFIAACEAALESRGKPEAWLREVDGLLASMSWDTTYRAMTRLIAQATGAAPAVTSAALHTSSRGSFDYLIVGAGFSGSVLAERLAEGLGKKVLVIDRRPHIGGNAYDERNAAGVLMHRYGPHIFHTNSADVFGYLSRFTEWRPYEHRVLAEVDGLLVPIPINRTTLNLLYGLDLSTDAEAAAFLAGRAEPVEQIRTSRDVVVSAVGRELYEKFFEGYTRKQWGLDPSQLDRSVTARVPTRTNLDDRYFTDTFQAMPLQGYTQMFERMLDHPNIRVETGADWRDVRHDCAFDNLVYTGPVDEYFDHCFGKLPYRSLRFRHETLDQEWFQPVGTVNYPAHDVPYTRISEYKHLTGQTCGKTTITYEYPSGEGDPYYPIPTPQNQALYKKYEQLCLAEPNVIFAGRLGAYRYYNMDQVVGQSLSLYRRIAQREGARMEGRDTGLSAGAP